MKDRRQFYRINDTISLNYRLAQDSDIAANLSRTRLEQAELVELRNAQFCIDARLDDICAQLKKDSPLVAELATLMNKKIALYERMMGLESTPGTVMSPAKDVNLSANGVAFEAETPIVEGSHLRLEIVTYPEHHFIPVYARVITCRKNHPDKSSGYTIAVEFEAISERDREHIIQHVFAKQAGELKKARADKVLPAQSPLVTQTK